MRRLFKITPGDRQPSNEFEKHLVTVATAWRDGKNQVKLESLDDFKKALQKEREYYYNDNKTLWAEGLVKWNATRSAILITYAVKGDLPSSMTRQPPSATIELLTAEELDHLEVQDSLLIPVRSC